MENQAVVPPLARTLENTCSHYGWSRTFIYEKLSSGALDAIKAGRRTLVTTASADDLFASLPQAVFRKSRQKTAA